MPFPYDPWCNTCGLDISMATWNENDGECFRCRLWWKKQDVENGCMNELSLEQIVSEINDLTKFLLAEPEEITAKNIVFMYKLIDELRDNFLDQNSATMENNPGNNRIDVI